MDRNIYHVPDKGWANKDSSKTRTGKYYPTQQQAYDDARRQVGDNGGGEVTISRKDNGKFRDKNTIPPGNDPRNIKG